MTILITVKPNLSLAMACNQVSKASSPYQTSQPQGDIETLKNAYLLMRATSEKENTLLTSQLETRSGQLSGAHNSELAHQKLEDQGQALRKAQQERRRLTSLIESTSTALAKTTELEEIKKWSQNQQILAGLTPEEKVEALSRIVHKYPRTFPRVGQSGTLSEYLALISKLQQSLDDLKIPKLKIGADLIRQSLELKKKGFLQTADEQSLIEITRTIASSFYNNRIDLLFASRTDISIISTVLELEYFKLYDYLISEGFRAAQKVNLDDRKVNSILTGFEDLVTYAGYAGHIQNLARLESSFNLFRRLSPRLANSVSDNLLSYPKRGYEAQMTLFSDVIFIADTNYLATAEKVSGHILNTDPSLSWAQYYFGLSLGIQTRLRFENFIKFYYWLAKEVESGAVDKERVKNLIMLFDGLFRFKESTITNRINYAGQNIFYGDDQMIQFQGDYSLAARALLDKSAWEHTHDHYIKNGLR